MSEERKIYRSPGRAAPNPPTRCPARLPDRGGPPTAAERQTPAPQGQRRRRSRLVLALCLLCLLVVAGVCIALTRCTSGPTGPAQADFGTPAAAWQKNDLGYYFNSSGEAVPAAVLKGIDVSKFQGGSGLGKGQGRGH